MIGLGYMMLQKYLISQKNPLNLAMFVKLQIIIKAIDINEFCSFLQHFNMIYKHSTKPNKNRDRNGSKINNLTKKTHNLAVL